MLCTLELVIHQIKSVLIHSLWLLLVKYALLYDAVENGGRAVYDESREAWSIPDLKTQRMHPVKERRRIITNGNKKEFANVIETDIHIPKRSTPDPDDPNTPEIIASILSMDLNEDMEEIRHIDHRRQDKLFRINDVSVVFCHLRCNTVSISLITSFSTAKNKT